MSLKYGKVAGIPIYYKIKDLQNYIFKWIRVEELLNNISDLWVHNGHFDIGM